MILRLVVRAVLVIAAVSVPLVARADWPEGGVQLGSVNHWLVNLRLWRDPSGPFIASYVDSWTDAATMVRTVAADGTPVWPQSQYVQTVPPSYQSVSRAPDEQGGLYSAIAVSSNVYLQRLTGAGAWMPGPTLSDRWTVSATTSSELLPTVLADGEGGCFVSWLHQLNFRMRRMTASGTSAAGWPDAGVVIGPTSYIPAPLALLPDGSDGVYSAGLGQDRVRVQRVSSSGAISSGWPAAGVTLGAMAPTSPTCHLIPSGNAAVIVVWTETPSGQPRRVVVGRVLETGVADPAWPSAGVIAATTTTAIEVVPDGLGGVYVAWSSGGLHLVRILADGTLAAGFPPGGVNPLDPGAVTCETDDCDFAIATGPAGGVIVAWEDMRSPSGTTRIRWLQGDGTPDPLEPDPARVFESRPSGDVNTLAMVSDGASTAWVLHGGLRDFDMGGLPETRRTALLYRLHAPVNVGVPAGPGEKGLALSAVWPNPARQTLAVRFALPGDEAAALEMFDVGGRLVRTRFVRGAGEHLERIDRLDALDPGLYFVRLRLGAQTRVARVVLAH